MEVQEKDGVKDLFFESDTFCTMTITYMGHWGKQCLEAQDFVPGGPPQIAFLNLDSDEMDLLTYENFGMVIIPDIIAQREDTVAEFFTQSRKDQLRDFVNRGGFIYASAKGGVLLEMMDIFPEDTYNSNFAYISSSNTAQVTGCEDVGKSPNTNSFVDHVHATMCVGKQDDVYLLASYKVELLSDPTIHPLLYFDSSDVNLAVKNLRTGMTIPFPSDEKIPFVLFKQQGLGGVIAVHGNAGYHTDYFQWFYNSVFVAMGKSVVMKRKVDFALAKEIPAMESGVILSITQDFYNIYNQHLSDFMVEFWLPENVVRVPSSTLPANCVEDSGVVPLPLTGLADPRVLCVFPTVSMYSHLSLSISVEILDASVTQKRTNVLIGYTLLQYSDSKNEGSTIELPVGELLINTKLSAELRCHVNPDTSGFYPVSGAGNAIDNVVPCENKEDTEAIDVEYIAIVPIVTPAVTSNNQVKMNKVLRFWDKHYLQSKNGKMEYPFPLVSLSPRDYDYLDYKFLAGKGVHLVGNWDTAVNLMKENRDGSFPTITTPANISTIKNVNYSTSITTNNVVTKQTIFQDSNQFYEHAAPQQLVFVDATTEDGASAFYEGGPIPPEKKHPTKSTEKLELVFLKADVFFYESLDNFVLPENVNPNDVISIDRYPNNHVLPCQALTLPTRCVVNGYFQKGMPNGLKENEYENPLLNTCGGTKNVIRYENVESATKGSVTQTRYLFPIIDEEFPDSYQEIMNFNASGVYIDPQYPSATYPEIRFELAYSFDLKLDPVITRRGGRLKFVVPLNPNAEVFFGPEHVAFYHTGIVGNEITVSFKRGKLPNENYGNPSFQNVIIENVDSVLPSFVIDVEIYEMKYNISNPPDYEVYAKVSTQTVTLKRQKYFSLPAVKMRFKLNRTNAGTVMYPYEYIEPMARYGVHYQELMRHRTNCLGGVRIASCYRPRDSDRKQRVFGSLASRDICDSVH